MGKGQSWGGGLGLGTEVTLGTGVSPTDWFPIDSESIKNVRPSVPTGGIYTSRMVQYQLPGIIECSGNFTMDADAHHLGQPLLYWNGQVTTTTIGAAASLTATAAAGGTIPAGVYYYQVSQIVQRTIDGKYFLTSAVISPSVTTTNGVNQTVNLAWTLLDITTLPGFTIYGAAVYRTAAGAAASTATLLHVAVGATVAAYSDTGSSYTGGPSTAVPPATTSSYRHKYVSATPVAGTLPLPSFTLLKYVDIADPTGSEQYVGGRMDKFDLSIGAPGEPNKATFDVMARTVSLVANVSPSYQRVRPMMNWQSFVSIGGTIPSPNYFEGATLACTNELTKVPGLSGNQYNRDFYPGMRVITGDLKFGFEDHTEFSRMLAATTQSVSLYSNGEPMTSGCALTAPVAADSFQYSAQFDLAKVIFQEAGGHLNKAERMIESIPFKTCVDNSLGYDMQVVLYNKTSSYA